MVLSVEELEADIVSLAKPPTRLSITLVSFPGVEASSVRAAFCKTHYTKLILMRNPQGSNIEPSD